MIDELYSFKRSTIIISHGSMSSKTIQSVLFTAEMETMTTGYHLSFKNKNYLLHLMDNEFTGIHMYSNIYEPTVFTEEMETMLLLSW